MIAVALIVLFAGGLALLIRDNRYNAPVGNPQANPSPFFRDGKVIPVPKDAVAVMHRFISDTVFRKNLNAGWALSTTAVHGGLTRSQWRTGSIPVAPFSPGTKVTLARTVESRQHRVWFELLIVPKKMSDTGSAGGLFFVWLVPHGKSWEVSYWGPKGWNPPVPSNGVS